MIELPPGETLRTIPVSGTLAGKSLRSLNLSERYGVTVVAVHVLDPTTGALAMVHAGPDTTLNEGDELVVLGPVGQVADLAEERPDREATVEVVRRRPPI